jgi:hypothetical protein
MLLRMNPILQAALIDQRLVRRTECPRVLTEHALVSVSRGWAELLIELYNHGGAIAEHLRRRALPAAHLRGLVTESHDRIRA